MRPVCCTFLALLLSPALIADDGSEFPASFPWGRLQATEHSVELHVTTVPDDRQLRIPRFNNPYKRIYLQQNESGPKPGFRPEVSEWLVTVPKDAEAPLTLVMETVGPPQLLTEPAVISPGEDGSFVLPAHHAVVHGKLLRYEPQPHKNTVGYWANEKDWCEWRLNATEPGDFHVHILQGCGKGHGGSRARISAGESSVTFEVEDTGHFQNFKDRNVGIIRLKKSGRQQIKVSALHKAKGAVMDVRQIRLVPVTPSGEGA